MASILDADYDSVAAKNASGSRTKSAEEKSGSSLPLYVILSRLKRNCVHCVRFVTVFHLFLFLTYSSPAAPSNISAHVDGSGTELVSSPI